MRPTGGTGHLYRHGAASLIIAIASPDFPLSRTLMHYRIGLRQLAISLDEIIG